MKVVREGFIECKEMVVIRRFNVGLRVIKTAIVVTMSVFLIKQLGLEESVGLAVLASLITVQRTFYYSIFQSMTVLVGVFLGGFLGVIIGYLIGDNIISYALLVLIGIPLCCRFKMYDRIVLTVIVGVGVILSGESNIGIHALVQIIAAMLGGSLGLVVNYMFNVDYYEYIDRKLKEVEECIGSVLDLIIREVEGKEVRWAEFKNYMEEVKRNKDEVLEVIIMLEEDGRYGGRGKKERLDNNYEVLKNLESLINRLELMFRMAVRLPKDEERVNRLIKLIRIMKRMQKRAFKGNKRIFVWVDRIIKNRDKFLEGLEMPNDKKDFLNRASLYYFLEEVKYYYEDVMNISDLRG